MTSTEDLLNAPVVVAAAEILGADNVRLVGGAVRDLVYGLEPSDLDMATPIPPKEVMKSLKAKGHRVIPTGLDHGTVTLVLDGIPLEITTLRQDVSTDGRRATVAFTDNWREDAMRRDFTFNALALSMSGEVIDYFGGINDLKHGRVSFVGDAQARIREDYLRILRYFRFYARFGKEPPPPELKDILRIESSNLNRLSGERIQKEIFTLLVSNGVEQSIDLMSQLGIDQQLFETTFNLDAFKRLVKNETQLGHPSAIRRLATLLGCDPKHLLDATSKLKLSNHNAKRLKGTSTICKLPLHEALYRKGREYCFDQEFLNPQINKEQLAIIESWERPTFPVTGQDLIERGFTTGTQLGEIKTRLENRWIDSSFKLSKQALLNNLENGL